MHPICSNALTATDRRPFDAAATGLRRRWGRFLVLYRRRRERRALASLDEHLLRDIGITRQQALAEAARPFWR